MWCEHEDVKRTYGKRSNRAFRGNLYIPKRATRILTLSVPNLRWFYASIAKYVIGCFYLYNRMQNSTHFHLNVEYEMVLKKTTSISQYLSKKISPSVPNINFHFATRSTQEVNVIVRWINFLIVFFHSHWHIAAIRIRGSGHNICHCWKI